MTAGKLAGKIAGGFTQLVLTFTGMRASAGSSFTTTWNKPNFTPTPTPVLAGAGGPALPSASAVAIGWEINTSAPVLAGVIADTQIFVAFKDRQSDGGGGITGDPAANPYLDGLTPLPGSRGTGVSRARALEVELVQGTGAGTLDWTPAEIAHIQQTGQLPPGIVGQHINNVAQFPNWAGDPRNIRLVRGQAENLVEHGGAFQNPTVGPLIDRQAMIDAVGGA